MRRADANARAVAQFVDVVEQIDDVQPGGEFVVADFEFMGEPSIDLPIVWQTVGIGEAGAKAGAIDRLSGKRRVVPFVGAARRARPALIVVEIDPMVLNIRQLVRWEFELA